MGDTRATVIILMREREGKAGGGKGFLLTSEKAFTLATSNFHTVFLFEATRVEDVRIYENYSPTVARYWGTGGARVPYVFEPKSAFEENWSESEVKNALRAEASKSSHAVVYPLDLRNALRDADKLDAQNRQGLGVGENGDPAPTVTNVFTPSVATPSTVRRLTPTECERLQGFPDGWTDGQADSHRYKQMGNAVAVPVVEWIIGRIK